MTLGLWLIACSQKPATSDHDSGTTSLTPPTSTPTTAPFVIPTPSCEPHENMPCFDGPTYSASSDGCTCVSAQLTCGQRTGADCPTYDPATWVGGTVTSCSDGGTQVAGLGPEGSWWAYRFDADGLLLGLQRGGSCGSMYLCQCCDGLVLDTTVEGDFRPCDPQ